VTGARGEGRPFEELSLEEPSRFEEALLETWDREDLFARTLEARQGAPPFVFYEGPPTANGRPGIHHVLARTLKDVVCRYRTLRGFRTVRKAGWDAHGLPVEIEVEKALGFSGKAEIERHGIAEFNRLCRESVFRYKDEWEKLSRRIGFWLDYADAYVTCSNEYVESVWYLLERFHRNGLLYRSRKVIPFCARCGTGLSSHEVGQGYRDVVDPSVVVLFPVAGRRGRYLAAWTTTPWTLPSNTALAVRPDLRYALVRRAGKEILLALDRIPAVFPAADAEVLEEFDGSALEGLAYEPIFSPAGVRRLPPGEWEPSEESAWKVRAADFVSSEEGTGIVHVAPSYGADDHALAGRAKLPVLAAVGEDGRFGEAPSLVAGLFFKEADAVLLRDLAKRGLLLRRETVTHAYPFCWRCETPLLYFGTPAWFLRTTAFKDLLVGYNERIRWVPPDVGEGRFGNWLEGNVDWALSRERYWGTPLPAWVCDLDEAHLEVFGSRASLAERAGGLAADLDLHRPAIDAVAFRCRACQGTMRRVPSLVDCWFDSGAMPTAQYHWPFENVERVRGQYPADFIAEGLDQTRGWFYTLHAIATFLTGVDRARAEGDPRLALPEGPAYRTCLVNGLVLDREGRKMSKRLGNTADPWAAIAENGADALRWHFLSSAAPWLPKRYDPEGSASVLHGFLSTLTHSFNFFALYARLGGFRPGVPGVPLAERPALDRWIASRVETTLAEVRDAMDAYDLTGAARTLERFVVEELSNWYIRRSRRRFWVGGEGERGAFETLFDALVATTRLLAPFVPFLSDALHRRLLGPDRSVHLSDLRDPDPERRDESLEASMDLALRLARIGRALREGARCRVRQPLSKLEVWTTAASAAALRDGGFDRLVAEELNVREVLLHEGRPEGIGLRVKPNYPALGKRYGRLVPAIERWIASLDAGDLWNLRAGKAEALRREFDGTPVEVRVEDLRFEFSAPPETGVEAEGELVVTLHTHVSEELRVEGIAREIVNRIQTQRRESGFAVVDRIRVEVRADAEGEAIVRRALADHEGLVRAETLAEGGIRWGDARGEGWREWELPGGGRLSLRLARL